MDVVNASMSNDEAKQRMSWLQERWTNTTRPAIRPATSRTWHSIYVYSSAASSYARKILVRIRMDNGHLSREWLCREGFGVEFLRLER